MSMTAEQIYQEALQLPDESKVSRVGALECWNIVHFSRLNKETLKYFKVPPPFFPTFAHSHPPSPFCKSPK